MGDLGRVDLTSKVDLIGDLARVDLVSKVDLIGQPGRVDLTAKVVLVARWASVGQILTQSRRAVERICLYRFTPQTVLALRGSYLLST